MEQILYTLLAGIIAALSLGLLTPWGICILYKWEAEHTVIEGRRLGFDGTGGQLFGNWIKWWFFTIITLGIYGFWVNIRLKQWITKHTYFA